MGNMDLELCAQTHWKKAKIYGVSRVSLKQKNIDSLCGSYVN